MLSPHERSQAEGSKPDREHDGRGADDPEPGVILRGAPGRVGDTGEGRGQEKEERAERGPLPPGLLAAVEDVNTELDGTGRVLVRPSGTEPLVRVLAEAETAESAEELCAKVAALVTHELG